MQRKPIDPYFQNKIKYSVCNRRGKVLAEVFVLNADMLPVKRPAKRGKGKCRV